MGFSLGNLLRQSVVQPQAAKARPVSVGSSQLQVAPARQGIGQAVSMAQPQGGAYNPGAIPIQDNHPLSARQDIQPAPYGAGQPQRSYDQQQRQVGVRAHNLNYLASQQNGVPNNQDVMVNVPWSSHVVPYSQSLHAPVGWRPMSTPTHQTVDTSYLPEPKPMLGVTPENKSILHKILGIF